MPKRLGLGQGQTWSDISALHDGQRIQAMAYAGDEDVPDEKKAPTSSLPELAVKVSLEIVLLATPHYSPWHNLNGAAHRPWKQHLQRINI